MDSVHHLVVVSLCLKLKRKANCNPGKHFDVELLQQTDTQEEYCETIKSSLRAERNIVMCKRGGRKSSMPS